MPINFDAITDQFVQSARDGVGSLLSQQETATGTQPSVIKHRQKGPVPDYPYVALDIITVAQTSGWLRHEDIDENNDPYWETDYKLTFQYTIYGGNANSIANTLEGYFRLPRVRDEIYSNTTGKLEQTFDVISLPERLATDNLDVAAFNFTYNITDRITDSQYGALDTINLTGELKRFVNDPAPLPINVNETSGALP